MLAARLPARFRSFDSWEYSTAGQPSGLRDFLTAVRLWVEDQLPRSPMQASSHDLVTKVLEAAGVEPGEYYRRMIGAGPSTPPGTAPTPGPFQTTADRQCGACGAVLPSSRFDGRVVPGKPEANRCRECVAAGRPVLPRDLWQLKSTQHAGAR